MTESRLPRYDLDPLVAPRSVALYGVSERTSAAMASNLKAGGRPLIGVHPVHDEVLGIRCVRQLADSGEQHDMVVMGVGHARIEGAVDDVIIAGGTRVVIVPGLGTESGDKGAPVAGRIGAKLAAAGIAMLGANCMGVATPEAPSPWIGWIPPTFLPGGVAAVVQSGSLGSVLVGMGPRTGFRTVISTGAEDTVDMADALAFLAADERTRVAGLFIEGVRRPAEFEEGLRLMAEAGKPVVVLKVGTSAVAARAALAHTGALVGSDRTFSAVLRHYGAIRVDDSSTWVEHLVAFGANRTPRGTRIGAITASGGEGEHVADCRRADRLSAVRPVAGAVRPPARAFPELRPHCEPGRRLGHRRRRRGVPRDPRRARRLRRVRRAAVGRRPHALGVRPDQRPLRRHPARPRVACRNGLYPAAISVTTAEPSETDLRYAYEHDLPLLRGVGAGVAALTARLAFAPVVPPPRAVPAAEPIAGQGALPEFDSAAILAEHGIPYVRAIRCATASAATDAAAEIGFPVVVKMDGPAHKARVDGVALGLADEVSVAAAATRMGGRVIVAEQVRGGVEVLLGVVRDPGHSAVVVAGVGGGTAEALDLAAASLAPLDLAGAEALVRAVPALARLVGEPLPLALLRAIVALGDLAASHSEITEIDVNPLLVRGDAIVALDALIVLGGTS